MPKQYLLHTQEERNHQDFLRAFPDPSHESARTLIAEHLDVIRGIQVNDAKVVLTNRRVSIGKGTSMVRVHRAEIGNATATVCFYVIERDVTGVITREHPILPHTEVWYEE